MSRSKETGMKRMREWSVEEFVAGLIEPRQVGRLETNARCSCCAFEPCHWLVLEWLDLQQGHAQL